jgi:Fe-S cluster assembly ATP-binding protein
LIKINNLQVSVHKKEILKWVSLEFEIWKNYLLAWKNGSGKSTLCSFLMWHPKYEHVSGEVKLDGEDLLSLSPEERSEKGLFLSFQNVPEIKGIRLSEYLRTIYNIHLKTLSPETKELSPFVFKRFIRKILEELKIDGSFLERELNVWFSGWEKRKIEILQMKLVGPKYIILDEIDSGLDLDAFKTVSELLKSVSTNENSLIIITHHFKILDYIDVDTVYVLNDGGILKKWWKELVAEISENGFDTL